MEYTLIFLDTETTGNGPQDRLCQLAYKKEKDSLEHLFNEFFKPPLPISIESMSIHHITEEQVADKPLFVEYPLYPSLKIQLEDPHTIVIAHNAPFDRGMLEQEDIRPTHWIDTLRLIRHHDATMQIPKHSLQYLRYYLKLELATTEAITAHDARSDILVLESLFHYLYREFQKEQPKASRSDILEKMITLSQTPSRIIKFTFGKYNGKTIEEVSQIDKPYLQWLLNQKKQSDKNEEDWIYTLEYFLKV